MAKDGLIFRFFATMNSRGVPACANFWLSIIAALCALYFSLEVLVEMMSIGTLLGMIILEVEKSRNYPIIIDQFHCSI